MPLSIAALVDEWLAVPTPPSPPSSLSPLSLLLPRIPSLPSSPTRRDSIPKADLPPQKRDRHSSLPFEIGESSTVDAARQPGSTLAQGTIDRLVVDVEETNERVTDLGTSYRQDSHEIYVRLQDAQDDRTVLRAHLASSEREARYLHTRVVTAEQEATHTHDAWNFAMDQIRELQHKRHEGDDSLTKFGERVRALERRDGPLDTGSSC
ncbi:hypothetical protein Tco_0663292 [Tanacetum coccineum]